MVSTYIGLPKGRTEDFLNALAEVYAKEIVYGPAAEPISLEEAREDVDFRYHVIEDRRLNTDECVVIDGENLPQKYDWIYGNNHISDNDDSYEILKKLFGKNFCLISIQ